MRQATQIDTFRQRVGSMIRMDFYRLVHTPLLYIMVAVSALIPALVLSMVSANEPGAAQTFTNVWQVVEMVQGGADGLGIMGMALLCNINMVFIFAAILVSIFVSHDYSSGFIKNIFTVHAKKVDYVVSKTVVGVFAGGGMVLAYLIGALLAGVLAGKSFDTGSAGAIGVVMCVLSKICLMGVFVPLYLAVAVFFKQRLWLTIIGAFVVGILFYPVAMFSAPLNSTLLNVLLCVAGAFLLGGAVGWVCDLILRTRDLA